MTQRTSQLLLPGQPLTYPYLLDLDEATLVRGFLEPGVALERQLETVVSGTISGEVYLKEQYSKPWYELIVGDKPVIVGHLFHYCTRLGGGNLVLIPCSSVLEHRSKR
jgi:hypothetical protein